MVDQNQLVTTIADMLAQAKTHHQSGRFPAAAELYRQVLAADPTQVEAHYLLGAACHAMSLESEAAASLREALRQRPDLAEVHHQLGAVLAESGQPHEAERCIRRALALKPQLVAAHHDLGVLLARQDRVPEAVASYHRVVELTPHDATAHFGLGAILEDQGDLDAAAACFRRAIEIDPAYAEAHSNLGLVLGKQEKLEEAKICCRRAIELKPGLVEAHNNLGTALQNGRELDEAAECFRKAISLKPDNAESHINYAISQLQAGQLAEGWPELEWRLQRKETQLPEIPQPRWRGEELSGRTILLRCEQGLGDTLHFIRYAELIAQRGGQVIVEVQGQLITLLEQSGFRGLIVGGSPLPSFDTHAPLMSLPGLLGTTLADIPNRVPYLSADPELVDEWRKVIGGGVLKVGIAWQGNPKQKADRFRSIPLLKFAPLAQIGVELINLQQGAGREQLTELAGKLPVRELDGPIDELHGAFMDTAAIIANLDVVVTCDTAIAHLAGALGARVWLALSSVPDWRWMLERSDTPWYPNMRLFRQSQRGRWDDVFERMRTELKYLL
jgi:Flp pilus assembly protein TadD